MTKGDPGVAAVVSRRADVLAALAEPKHKRDLVAELDLSRSTIDRAVRELDARDLVTRDDGYRRTVAGRVALEAYDEFLADLEGVAAAAELLRYLPPDAPMSPAMLRGATVTVAEPPSPAAAVDPLLDLYDRAEHLRGFAVARTRPEVVDRGYDRLLQDGVRATGVYDRSLADHLLETDERFREAASLDRVDLYVHDDLPFGLDIATEPDGETAAVTCYDDERTVRGVIVNDSPAACEWAADVFDRYRQEADPPALS